METLNKWPSALSESFVPTFRFEELEIHKVFLRFPNLNLEQNLSPIALGDFIRASLAYQTPHRKHSGIILHSKIS